MVNTVTDNPTNDSPGVITADKLEPGMWVFAYPRHSNATPSRVLFRSDVVDGMVSLVSSYGTFNSADTISAGLKFIVASEAEVDQARRDSRRRLVAAQLHKLAALIEDNDLPLGRYPHVTFTHDSTPEELAAVAAVVGVEVENPYHDNLEVTFGSTDGFRAEWSGKRPYVADPLLPLGHEFMGAGKECLRTIGDKLCRRPVLDHVPGDQPVPPAAPKPTPPKKAAVKRAPAVDRRAARDQDDAATRPAGADQ